MPTPYIQKENLSAAQNFVGGPLWQDIKRCLLERRPAQPDVADEPNTAASKSHQRTGYEKCIEEIEALPFDTEATNANPLDRPAVNETAD